jgi:hypothetical protein
MFLYVDYRYFFWKDVEYSITEFSGSTSLSIDTNTYAASDIIAGIPADIPICYKKIPIFLIDVIANLDVDERMNLKLLTRMNCTLLEDGLKVD